MILPMKRIVFVCAMMLASAGAAYADFGTGFAAYSRGDYETAIREWTALADQGDTRAQVGLGFMHEKGLGVAQDHTKAVRWYRQASDQGDPVAQYNLGVMFGNGTGVLQDYVAAHVLFSQAAAQGNQDAENSLTYIEKLMTPEQVASATAQLLAVQATAQAASPAADLVDSAKAEPQQQGAAPAPRPTAVAARPAQARPQAAPEPPQPPSVAARTPVEQTRGIEPIVVAEDSPEVRPAAGPSPAAAETTQVAARAAPEPEPTPAVADGPWAVHLSSVRSDDGAQQEWARLRELYPGPLTDLALSVQTIDLPEKGRFYRVLAGPFQSESAARNACNSLATADQYCRPMQR